MTPEHGQNQLSQAILFSLGLTPEIAARIDQETQRRHAILQVIEQNGRSLYEDIFSQEYPNFREVKLWNMGNLYNRELVANKHKIYSEDPFLRSVPDTLTLTLPGFFRTELQNVPDVLHKEVNKFYRSDKLVIKNTKSVFLAFLRGFGNAALDKGDYATAVNAFDVASTNGIVNDRTAMAKLTDIAQTDEVAGVRIAQAIQTRINRTQTQPSSAPRPLGHEIF